MGGLIQVLTHPGVLPLIGAGAAWLAQKTLGARRWKWVQSRAKEILGDKADPITDPHEAVKKAMAEAMRAEVARVAAKLDAKRRAQSQNGAH